MFGKSSNEDIIDKKNKSLKKRIGKVFKFGTKSNRSEGNEKSKSNSVKSKFKSFLKRQNAQHKDECKWLLQQSSSQIYSGINESENDINEKKKNIRQKKQKEKKLKEPKENSKKSKTFVKKVGKITLQTCRYISMGTSPGFTHNPTSHYNYETRTYEYYTYHYGDPQSPSIFF